MSAVNTQISGFIDLANVEAEDNVTITVKSLNGRIILENSGRDLQGAPLILEGDAVVNKWGIVNWDVDPGTNIKRIRIMPKENQLSIWKKDKDKKLRRNAGGWTGQVKNGHGKAIEWKYSLYCELEDSTIDVIDPIIRVNK